MSKRIAVYNGSFNPPTIAHKEVIKRLQKVFAEVWLVPCINYGGEELIPVNYRTDLLELLIRPLNQTKNNIKVLTIGYTKRIPENPYNLMKLIKEAYPTEKFYFVCGSDFVNNIDNIENWEQFLAENNCYLIPRKGIKLLEEKLELFLGGCANCKMTVAPKIPNISQKEIRNFLSFNFQKCAGEEYKEDGEDLRKFIPEEIWEYIYTNELYNKL